MSEYNLVSASTLTHDVKERKAARRKIIEAAQKLERESFLAHMGKKRHYQQRSSNCPTFRSLGSTFSKYRDVPVKR